MIYKFKVEKMPIFMIWDGMVAIYHKKYLKELGITKKVQKYIQSRSRILKKTFESNNFEFRRGTREDLLPEEF